MATRDTPLLPSEPVSLSRAVVAGLVGGIAFGFLIQFVIQRTTAIGALYVGGSGSLLIGWIAHMVHSGIFGAVFGMLTEQEPLHSWMERSFLRAAAVGIAFALVLWFVNIGFVWPVWLRTMGYPPADSFSVAYLAVRPLFGHLVYGVILGVVFHRIVDY